MRPRAPVPARWRAAFARRLSRLRGDQRGASEMISMVITFPLVMLLILAGYQAMMAARANQVMAHAVQEAAREARERNGDASLGAAKGAQVMSALSPGLFANGAVPGVSVVNNGETVRASATGVVVSVVPGISPTITQVSEGPVEKFRGPP